ncbi:unnamed protein product [Orchesella dallaii]|uniref:Uncharacterized protein n=1 Tax=Orchesella dallaii TaxID=48710 RepID=A0ABP1R8C0_9HEXA
MTSTLWDTVNGNKTADIGMTSPASPRKNQTPLELHIQDVILATGEGAKPKVPALALRTTPRAFRTVSQMDLATQKSMVAIARVQKYRINKMFFCGSRQGFTSTKKGTTSKTGGLKMQGHGDGAHSGSKFFKLQNA